MSAPFVAAWMTMRRIQLEEQERLNSLSNQQVTTTTTNTTNKITLPEAPKQEVSRFAQWSFYLIFFALGGFVTALGFLAAGIAVAVVSSFALCAFALLTSISLGILSLRENR
jgi:hypothetical protein